jgi:hypothetical protein
MPIICIKWVLHPRKDRWMCCQKVRVGHVHVLLPVVLWVTCSTVCLILHEHPHELVLSHQQIFNADRCKWWGWRWIGMWGLSTTMTTAGGSLRDVKRGILSGSGSHHLS